MATITENYKILTPAYGRDYKTKKEVEKHFRAGKDFLLQPEDVYCSIRDFQPGVKVEMHYAKISKVTIITV